MSAMSHRGNARSHPYAAAYLVAALSGAAIGAAIAMPIPDVAGSCPAPEEGLVLCTIQKAWLPAAAKVLIGATAMLIVVRMLVNVPAPVQPRPAAGAVGREATPPFDSDPYLLVATWGNSYVVEHDRDGAPRHRWRDRHGRELRLREPRPG